jgi:hypothetical protein
MWRATARGAAGAARIAAQGAPSRTVTVKDVPAAEIARYRASH